jgi:DNA-binding SARP family transcriptional activator
MLEVSLFGKPTVRVNALEVSLSTRKALGLVGYLALEGATSRAKLADLLWGELDDSASRTNLRQELRRIRATTLEDHLLVEGDQLKLKSPLETDVTKFQNAINAEQFEAALEYCKGVFLEGTEWHNAPGFEEWVDAWRETLSSQRRNALKRQAVTLEAAGNPRGALAAHLALLEDDELQEHHHREAMRLHSMLGERKEALARFERCYQILKQELGLEPLPETIRLAERIRSGRNSSLKPSKTVPAENPFQAPPMIGRDQLWTQLETSESSLILIEGEPGVGKTRLAQEFAQASGNTLVLSGQELSSSTPLFPVASALRAYLASQTLELEAIWRHEAARLVPELEPDALSVTSEALPEGRARFLEGLTHALIAAVQPNGTLLLDDFHWFDATSSELIVQLSKRAKAAGIKLIATARPSELSENPAATRAIAHLERDGLMTRIHLEPLSETMILSLVQAISGSTGGTVFAKRLFDATAGNPLFVLETLRDLLEAGTLFKDSSGVWVTPYDAQTQDYAELPLAQSVRQAVLQRIDRLGPAVRRMLDAASLTGDNFQLAELTQATALDEWLGLEALERANHAGILQADQQGHRFHHDLIRRSLSNALSADRRKLLHKRLAATLESTHGEPARIADHLEQADLKTQAASWRIKAAEAARAVYAYRDALEHYARALENGVNQHEQFRIHTARAVLWKALDERIGWGEDVTEMQNLAEKLGEPNLEIEAELSKMVLDYNLGKHDESLQLANQLLERQDLSELQSAQVHLECGNALWRLKQATEAEIHLQEALRVVPQTEYDLIGRINRVLLNCILQRRDFVAARATNKASLKAFQRAGNSVGQLWALIGEAHITQLESDSQTAIRLFQKALNQAKAICDVGLQRVVLQHLPALLLELGEMDKALPYLQEGLELSREPQDPRVQSIFLNQIAEVHMMRGELGAALEAAQHGLDLANQLGMAFLQVGHSITLADIWLECGDFKNTHEIMQTALKKAEKHKVKDLIPSVHLNLARCELMMGQSVHAQKRLESLLKNEDRDRPEVYGRARCFLARLYFESNEPKRAQSLIQDLEYPLAVKALSLATQIRITRDSSLKIDLENRAEKLIQNNRIPVLEYLNLMKEIATTNKNLNLKKHKYDSIIKSIILKISESLPIFLKKSLLNLTIISN